MKNEKSKQLYEFILKEAPVMTEEWLKTRTEEGSLYSKHASEETEMKLKEQNTAFIQTIAATLVTLSDKVENHLKNGLLILHVIEPFTRCLYMKSLDNLRYSVRFSVRESRNSY